jgi:hypothetical protein
MHPLEDLDAGEPGHVDVEEDRVGALLAEPLQRRRARERGDDLVAALEVLDQDLEQLRLIVDEQ